MTDNKQNQNDAVETLIEQGKEFFSSGNTRRIILRTADGNELADVSMTVAFIGIGVLMFFGPAGFTLAFLAVIAGILAKVRVEIVRELGDDDDTVVIDGDEDNGR
jgi:hypothetical protein